MTLLQNVRFIDIKLHEKSYEILSLFLHFYFVYILFIRPIIGNSALHKNLTDIYYSDFSKATPQAKLIISFSGCFIPKGETLSMEIVC